MVETAIFALLHVLVFVYWLGGDLGAFYSSRFLIADGVSADRRLLAAKVVGDVDMAPRSALILAFPTGFLLAISKGWLDVSMAWGWAALLAGLAWLAVAWRIHIAHGQAGAMRTVDLAIRWIALAALAGAGFAGLAGIYEAPAFISLKLLLLAAAIAMGLAIRRVLAPLGPALAGLNGDAPASAEARLKTTLQRVRPLVTVIWAILLAAAFLGLWTPTVLEGA
ncbi:MAG: hypothetical protein AAFX03_00240 [Pseudomonadota bacterium]